MRRSLILVCCSLVAGCQNLPVLDCHYGGDWREAAAVRKDPQRSGSGQCNTPRTIVVFEETPADSEAVKQVVLRHIPPGTPIDQARALLEQQGFTCRAHSALSAYLDPRPPVPRGYDLPVSTRERTNPERERQPVYCNAALQELQDWGLTTRLVLVVLYPDEANAVQALEVSIRSRVVRHPDAGFFARRPELHEPVGLPVEEARARMAAAGFFCTGVEQPRGGPDARPYVLCQSFNENWLGGRVVRVYLYPDASGVVRQTRTPEGSSCFDAERSMLPHGDEPVPQAVCKGALFPVRAGCRYALVTGTLVLCVTACVLAMSMAGYAGH
jgi:hypothetical protein